MATRLFEGKSHASHYQKYRLSPPQKIQDLILNYLGNRLKKPFGLAVDVGCGTGQTSRSLVPYFQKVLGTDISEAQIEQANHADGFPNLVYRVSAAEEIPAENASVDLITACAAVHWFDIEKFLKEADRVLKPCGCLAFFTYLPNMEVHYKHQSQQLTQVITELQDVLSPYVHEKVQHVISGYKDIFNAIPYTDKKRVENIDSKISMSLKDMLGLIQTFSMYQTFLSFEPEKAKDLVKTTEQR
ncbi:hypothetical protein XENTR_v10024278 [Xenopus tropicalis]|nr:hypothetical protein XENTR_v10024278 [Xenopus tropicalis]